ncbi:hypothetical protein BaRGS_00036735 [Batillaria attramentaria]|uniref:Uncharacterized protein n=1 Tax=Batillaria attramentaria TaxID=370345 RepID=A0ABD0JAZ1_9CAEN
MGHVRGSQDGNEPLSPLPGVWGSTSNVHVVSPPSMQRQVNWIPIKSSHSFRLALCQEAVFQVLQLNELQPTFTKHCK